jgi:hypothetical protein
VARIAQAESVARRIAPALALVLLSAGVATANAAVPRGTYPANGLSLYLHCSGRGSPAVVLDAGLGNDHTYWRGIESSVGTTRVCSWDRPGWGASERPRGRRLTATAAVRDLKALLVAAGVRGPYVLAGHSIGGLDVQTFAQLYPRSVAGIVLVDSTSPAAFPRYDAAFPIDGLVFDVGGAARRLRARPLHVRWPLIVLEHGVRDPVLDAGGWHAYQRGLTRISTEVQFVRASSSGHDIALDQPMLVTAALRAVVAAARSTHALPPCVRLFARHGGACESTT